VSVEASVNAVLAGREGVPEDLREIALVLARILDIDEGKSAASISKELRATLTAIEAVMPAKVVSAVDELAATRRARRANAKNSHPAGATDKRGG
jgi:hypothetical protein